MAGFVDFIKDIFMAGPETGLVGLSEVKIQKKQKLKKHILKHKKDDLNLSGLMRKNNNKLSV